MRQRLKRLLCWIIILFAFAIALLVAFRGKYYPAIRALAQNQVKSATSDMINHAIDRHIDSGDIQYDRIVYFEKDLDGRITALKTNMSEVNRLKTEILDRLNDDILSMDESELGIPLGDLLLPEFLAGKGPSIPVRILTIRNSDATFSNSFTEAGINQTLLRLNMDVVLDVTVLVLGKTDTFTVVGQVVVAETVIVGQVPNTFLQTGGFNGN